MAVRMVVAVTDGDWFDHLRVRSPLPEVNFWAPGAAPFKALQPGEFFLFKLHAPLNFIVGGGVFTYSNTIPCSLAWEAFGDANGATSLGEMRRRIVKYRRADPADRGDFVIGCRILTKPFFFTETEWIPVPETWSRNIVTFKTYDASEGDGAALWQAVQERLTFGSSPIDAKDREQERYGAPALVRPRLGQGAFRVIVTDAYQRRCAVTRERTLPALEAAHIRPFADGGAHEPSNGLLLRRDIHSLFDAGYVTVTPALQFRVSRKIKEEFENGRNYYAMDGQTIAPVNIRGWEPNESALRWHNKERFLG